MTVIRRTAAASAQRRRTLLALGLLFAACFATPLLFDYLWPRITKPSPSTAQGRAEKAPDSPPATHAGSQKGIQEIAVPVTVVDQDAPRPDAHDAVAAADSRAQVGASLTKQQDASRAEAGDAGAAAGPRAPSEARGIVTRLRDAIARWWLAIRAYILVAAVALIAGLIAAGLLEKPQRPPVIAPPLPRPVQDLPHGVARFVSPSLFVKEGVWKAVAASVAGTSHARTKQPCQDASYCRVVGGNTLIGAVADGAGSARLGGEGAQVAARAAVEAIAAGLAGLEGSATSEQWKCVLRGAMGMARVQVEISSALLGAPLRELACTLLLFVARPGLVVASQIGDGAVVVRDAGGEFHSLTTPQNGEYANTTTFLVSPDALKTVQHQAWEKAFTGLAAFTDGLQRLALVMPVGNPHVKFFAPLFGFTEKASDADIATRALDEFLRSSKVTERADDDLTILLARLAS